MTGGDYGESRPVSSGVVGCAEGEVLIRVLGQKGCETRVLGGMGGRDLEA